MNITKIESGITFTVDEVNLAKRTLHECRTHEALKNHLHSDIESCYDYHGTVVADVYYHPLLAAVYTAFSQHRPLVLTPDVVWVTIAQGVAHHMTIHAERLRSRFVSHQGRLDLKFVCKDWVEGSPENPWSEAFNSWAEQIRDHAGTEIHDLLVCDFSTTSPVERTVSQIVMMDIFERYFHYVVLCVCGIPSVTLEGTVDDWQRLTQKVRNLHIFDLDWWLEHLLPICEQFERASNGDIDLNHWQSICKLREKYGGDIINGWVAKLFPYLREHTLGPCTRKNPIFETGEGFQTSKAPPGLSLVPFTWQNLATNRTRCMEAIGGFVGMTQDRETKALRPKIGWAIREAEKMDVLLARLTEEHKTFSGIKVDSSGNFPSDLGHFYQRTNGAELFGQSGNLAYRIVSMEEFEKLDWGLISSDLKIFTSSHGQIWYRLAWLTDGSYLAVAPNPQYPEELEEQIEEKWNALDYDKRAAICHCRPETQGKPGMNPVIALSFTELLEQILDSRGEHFWLDPSFVKYGDAEDYTWRG